MLLLAVSTEGEVRGYFPAGMTLAAAPAATAAAAADDEPSVAAQVTADPAHERMLQELLQRKMVRAPRGKRMGAAPAAHWFRQDLARELKRLQAQKPAPATAAAPSPSASVAAADPAGVAAAPAAAAVPGSSVTLHTRTYVGGAPLMVFHGPTAPRAADLAMVGDDLQLTLTLSAGRCEGRRRRKTAMVMGRFDPVRSF